MTTWKLASAIAIISLAGCGGDQRPHTEAPPLPEPEEIEESGPGESEPVGSETAEPEAAETEAGLPAPEPQKECPGLPKSTCEATVGCAWSTTDDCVYE